MNSVEISLADLVGTDYAQAVCRARSFYTGEEYDLLFGEARRRVSFLPQSYLSRCDELLSAVGKRVVGPFSHSARGAGTASFEKATHRASAPVNGYGPTRIGEDGRLYLISKSEHYHASLGHAFPGYEIVDIARRLGISSVTHNNTRGHITRLLELALVAAAAGREWSPDDAASPGGEPHDRPTDSTGPHVLNRIINLETGSLAVEAAVKMMLARFYRLERSSPKPPFEGRVPVFLVIGDLGGGLSGNYHGTTTITQMLRGLWPALGEGLRKSGGMIVEPVAINDLDSFRTLVDRYDHGGTKVAGFLHEIVLMNYGAIRLTEEYLREVYRICDRHDIPVLADEIQSCMWSPELFLSREYGITPDFISAGKGFPGGNTPASRILTTAAMDNLSQFGALVTNGQEELASLYYLVTMAFMRANGEQIREVGSTYHEELMRLQRKYPQKIVKVEGLRHLSSLFFDSADHAQRFAGLLNEQGIDISVQAYKEDGLPVALTKLPLIAGERVIEFLVSKMDAAVRQL